MDRGSKAAYLKAAPVAAAALVALAWPGAARAQQDQQQPTQGTDIFGSQELPKGLTIVPWKESDPGTLASGPIRLVEEPLEPLDPEKFRQRMDRGQRSEE